ncbi:hypothetical protein M3Y94_00155700 [Aphelenchoides besseyi]|nr:hypothetical protein M3Y94_00155700 [Aphelenchoides besseyi]
MNRDPWTTHNITRERRADASTNLRSQGSFSPGDYSVIDDHGAKFNVEYEYDDPEYYASYERPPEFLREAKSPQTISTMKSSSLANPTLTAPISHSTLQRLYSDKNVKSSLCSRRLKLTTFVIAGSMVVILLVGLFLWHVQSQNMRRFDEVGDTDHEDIEPAYSIDSTTRKPTKTKTVDSTAVDPLITANLLATLLVTRRKLCLFEVSTAEVEQSREDYVEEHIYSARLLLFTNLTHGGVPVHPLQFQRYLRNMGVDSGKMQFSYSFLHDEDITDCHVVLYDRGQQIWSAYAAWIFNWKARAQEQSNLYKLEDGAEKAPEKLGSFHAYWIAEFVKTFDDEYTGKAKGAVFGHIRTAVNIPIASNGIYNWENNTWPPIQEHYALLKEKEVSGTRPIIIYDGTSLRSTMVWFALRRLGIEASVYFGSWSEFAVRAPDSLKVLPSGLVS